MAITNSTRITVSCGHCGQLFTTTNSILSRGRGKYCSRRCAYDAISARTKNPKSGRARAGRAYPEIGDCERCGLPARDRHHIDGDTLNNDRSNVLFVCRRCHMELDGRIVVTLADVEVIRRSHVPNKHGSALLIAKQFGISPGYVHAIVYGARKGNQQPYRRPCSIAGASCLAPHRCRSTCARCALPVCGGCSIRRGDGGSDRICLRCVETTAKITVVGWSMNDRYRRPYVQSHLIVSDGGNPHLACGKRRLPDADVTSVAPNNACANCVRFAERYDLTTEATE